MVDCVWRAAFQSVVSPSCLLVSDDEELSFRFAMITYQGTPLTPLFALTKHLADQ
jgi:hypothetical protein